MPVLFVCCRVFSGFLIESSSTPAGNLLSITAWYYFRYALHTSICVGFPLNT